MRSTNRSQLLTPLYLIETIDIRVIIAIAGQIEETYSSADKTETISNGGRKIEDKN